jgi:hypothetical protein
MRTWTLDEATASLPWVRSLVQRMRAVVSQARDQAAHVRGNGRKRAAGDQDPAAELRAVLGELDEAGIVVRDPARGLIDFPAAAPSGRTYHLCWLDGEDAIEWWHWPEDGFAGRTPLSRPPH